MDITTYEGQVGGGGGLYTNTCVKCIEIIIFSFLLNIYIFIYLLPSVFIKTISNNDGFN